MKLPKIIAIFLLTVLGVSSLIIALIYIRNWNSKRQYNEFILAERETISMFDALNEDIVEDLPEMPSGSTLQKKWSIGIDAPMYEHGRWLWMEIATTDTSNFILEYYSSYLLTSGWQVNSNHRAFDDAFYYKGTSCIEINPPTNQNGYYRILIWHDFRNQSFSPNLPDSDTMSQFEMGMVNVATCP